MVFNILQKGLLSLFLMASLALMATDSPQHQYTGDVMPADAHEEEPFNPGDVIIEHVIDAHDWHIMTIGHKHISIPLPIILFQEGHLLCFSSSAFTNHHSHKPAAVLYNAQWERLDERAATPSQAAHALALLHHPPHKGKIVPVDVKTYLSSGQLVAIEGAEAPLDFSITKNVFALMVVALVFLLIFMAVAKSYKRREGQAPKGLQSVVEPLIVFIRDDIAKSSIGEKKYKKYVPFLLTVFFFIFISNLMGLIPIFPAGANLTGNLAITAVLALFTFVITTFSGNKSYWQHIFNTPGVPWWLKFPVPLMPIVELTGVFIKPFVLMVRLFANILAGHIIILGFVSLIFIFGAINVYVGYGVSIVSVLFSLFLSVLEILVALIQAYVFTLLSALYFGAAVEEHH